MQISTLVSFNFIILVFIHYVKSSRLENDYCERDENGACIKEVSDALDDGPCLVSGTVKPKSEAKKIEEEGKLVRLEGYKTGHVQDLDLGDGTKLRAYTRAMRPLLFEIPNFITDDEIEHIKAKAEDTGMFKSLAKGGLTPKDDFKPAGVPGKSLGPAGTYEHWDVNNDGFIDIEEVKLFAFFYNFLKLNDTDVREMFHKLQSKSFDDERITREEFETLDTQGIDDYINIIMREHPRFRQRFSDQTWLPMARDFDTVLHTIRERVVKLTKLPRKIVYGSEHLQVVRYSPFGHYHAHHDSETHERTEVPCCHQTDTATVTAYGKCRLCRLITLMVYLNDVDEGGETAFPVADEEEYIIENIRDRRNTSKDYFNLSTSCHSSNLVITPKKGTAVLWYNHYVDPNSGYLGEMDEMSLHGGCDVIKGIKWIANFWITAPYESGKDLPSMYLYANEYEQVMQELAAKGQL